MSFDAYDVAINLKLEDQFSDAIGEFCKRADELQKNLSGLGAAFGAPSISS